MRDELEKLAKHWAIRCLDLQDLMIEEYESGNTKDALINDNKAELLKSCIDDINSILNIDKELGGSGALSTKDGVLHYVRGSHTSGADSDKKAPVNGSLGKRTDTENKCVHDWRSPFDPGHRMCAKCGEINLFD